MNGDPPPPHLLPHIVRVAKAQAGYDTTVQLTLNTILCAVGVAFLTRSHDTLLWFLLGNLLANVATKGFNLWLCRKNLELASKGGG